MAVGGLPRGLLSACGWEGVEMDGSRTPGSVHPWSLLTRRVPSGRPGNGLRVSAASGWAPFAPWGAEGRGAVVLGSTRDASC